MMLEQKDLEAIERLVYKGTDDIAVAIGRSFERLEERIDGAETRIYSRLSDIEDRIEECGSLPDIRETGRDQAVETE